MSAVAGRDRLTPQHLFGWRREARRGRDRPLAVAEPESQRCGTGIPRHKPPMLRFLRTDGDVCSAGTSYSSVSNDLLNIRLTRVLDLLMSLVRSFER